ncbi:MAG: nucleoside deaminase [Gammaproteobacteria bacterium]
MGESYQLAAMQQALATARRGQYAGEPPVGACLVHDGEVIAVAHTGVVAGPDATAHAEMLALRAGCQHLRTARLADCELFVTVEPCAMCLAAACYAGITRIYFGAPLESLDQITGAELRGPVPGYLQVSGGLLAAESELLLREWADARGAQSSRQSPMR